MAESTLSSLDHRALHEVALNAKKDFYRSERLLASCLLEIERRQLFYEWATSSTIHYAELILELDGHTAREMMRTARALSSLPKLADAYYGGDISASKVREITRVATAETEDFWIESATKYNCRQIEMMVAKTWKGRMPGQPHPETDCYRAVKTRLRLDFEPEQLAIVMEAVALVNKLAGESIPLSEAIELIAQDFLNTAHREEDIGNRFRMIIHCDPASKIGWVNSTQGVHRVSDETLEQATCDAEILDLRKVNEQPSQSAPTSTQSATMDDAEPAAGRPTWDARQTNSKPGRPTRGEPNVDSADSPEDSSEDSPDRSTAVWNLIEAVTRGIATRDKAAGMARTVSPSVMRHVQARDQYRCTVPGCRMHIWKEAHHLEWRLHGGDNSIDNLVLLCSRHHKMIHRGQLFVSGTPSTGLVWRDAHGRILRGSVPSVQETRSGNSLWKLALGKLDAGSPLGSTDTRAFWAPGIGSWEPVIDKAGLSDVH